MGRTIGSGSYGSIEEIAMAKNIQDFSPRQMPGPAEAASKSVQDGQHNNSTKPGCVSLKILWSMHQAVTAHAYMET